tara:strand:- start:1113 stop:2153 length:1041 start_codon:yes stop_codon:yes gene_type:complete
MKKKILIFKNDRVGDLTKSIPAIDKIISTNSENEVVVFLSKISEKFYFLFKKDNTELKILNYNLSIIEKIKIFSYILRNKIEKIYILSPKNYYFYLPLFFPRINFFGLCVNGQNGYKRPNIFLRKILHKFVINDRETTLKRKSTQDLQLELAGETEIHDKIFVKNLNSEHSENLKKYLPKDYMLIHYKKKIFEELNWSVDELQNILTELQKYSSNVVLIKDIEQDEKNIIFKNRYKTFDFKKNKFFDKPGKIFFFDNIDGLDLYNVIKCSKKVIATHGMMTNLGALCRKPVLDLYHCVINNKDDYHSYKNAFYEFKASYSDYDFIIPSKNIEKTIKKMRFSLIKNT